VGDVIAERLAYGARVGVVPVGRDLCERLTDDLQGSREEPLRWFHVALLAQEGLDEAAIPVDGPVEVAPTPLDAQVCLVSMSLHPALTAPLGPQAVDQQRGEAGLPVTHRLVVEDKAADQEHLGQIVATGFVAQPPQDDE